jgi:glycosyltransferase involved in cell wall biosynthesis
MINPLISVVMSVYNSEKYLEEAIDSILTQTYENFEFIIINDGSKDNSLDIIQKYMKKDERIVLISQENKGLPCSLNEGIQKAKGKYIVRMDADDISFPNRLEEQIKFMENNPEIGVSGTYVEFFGNGTNKIWKTPLGDEECKCTLLVGSCFAHPSVIIRKNLLLTSKSLYDLKMYTAQDYALWITLSSYTKFSNIDKVLLKYRKVENSISSKAKRNLEKKFLIVEEYINKNLNALNIKNPVIVKSIFCLLTNSNIFNISKFMILKSIYTVYKDNEKLDIYESNILRKLLLKKAIIFIIKSK